jgi:hypothetical protein
VLVLGKRQWLLTEVESTHGHPGRREYVEISRKPCQRGVNARTAHSGRTAHRWVEDLNLHGGSLGRTTNR